jgi:hypothetical protein
MKMRPLTERDRQMIVLALTILRDARDTPGRDQRPTPAIRLALLALLPHCPETWPLTSFWDGISGDHEIGRAQSVTAAFNGIIRQLEASGRRPPGQAWG